MGAEVAFAPTPAQWAVINSRSRITIFIAGTGTGKTYVGRYWLAHQIERRGKPDQLTGEPAAGLVFSPSFPSYSANMRQGAIAWLERLGWGAFNATDRMLALHPALGGGRVYFRSGEAPLAAEGIHAGIGVWIDEPGQVDQATWEVALRRASLAGSPILLTGYPLSASGWYKDLYDRGIGGDPDILVVRGRTEDSPFYDKAALAFARATLPEWRFRQIYEGEFSRALGAIYPPAPIAALPDETRKALQTYGGADYGWGATAGVLVGWEGRRCWVLGSYKAGEATNELHAGGFRSIGMDRATAIFGDPAAKQSWPDFARHGLQIRPAQGGPGSVLAGITRLIGMVQAGELVLAAGAPGIASLLDEWDSYRWHTDADGRLIKEEPIKENDHILDALRYAITSSRPGHAASVAIGRGPYHKR